MITTGVTEKYVSLHHGKVRYLEAGEGAPTIALHGVNYAQGADTWRFAIEPMARKRRIIAVDMLGWGLGDRIEQEYSFSRLVDFVRELQDALGLERSHIVGHSLGGWIAGLFAYESPNRVDKLVLVDSAGMQTAPLPNLVSFKPPTREQIRSQLDLVKEPGVDLDQMADELEARVHLPGALEAYQRILNHMNNPVNRQHCGLERRLPYIKVPALIVWGRQDTGQPPELGERMHQLMPGSKMVWIEDCGHFVPFEHPKELAAALDDFLG